MTASLQATAQLAGDPLFQGRVQAAMVTAAIDVAAEAVSTDATITGYNLRHALAVAILQGSRLPGSLSTQPGVPWLPQFTWATAANVTIAGDIGPPVSIASSTGANPAVITTASAHGLATGQWAEIAGHLVNDAVNGIWAVTVLTTTTFSVPAAGDGTGGATGTVTLQPPDSDIQFAVNSVFGSIAGVGAGT